MADWIAEALVSQVLKVLIQKAKEYKSFKPLSKDLVSTMETLLPVIEQIESLHNELDFHANEIKELKETTRKALAVIEKCKRVSCFKKPKRTREIKEINENFNKFCGMGLQLLQYRNQLLQQRDQKLDNQKIENSILGFSKRMDDYFLSVPPMVKVYTDLCSAPKLDKVIIGLEWPLMEVKKKLLDDSVTTLVVSAPPGCGKTTLATQLCHHKDIKVKFTHIFFNVVSSTPNFRGIVQNLFKHNGFKAPKFENDSQAAVGLRKILKELRRAGPILLVLDDVWDGAESFLQNFKIKILGYKLLVTSRFEFLSFGSTYPLKPLGDEDAKALFFHWASKPSNASPSEYEDILQKISKRCNGFPIVIEVVGVSLKGQNLNWWKGQVESWSEGGTVLDKPNVLKCLQPSFDALDSNLQECFLDMGLFLEDQKIRASVIVDIWVELYGKGSVSCMKYLQELASQNLLKIIPLGSDNEDGFYNDFLVTQHDILRELAIHQSEKEGMERKRLNLVIRDNKFPENLKQPMKARLLSISTDDLFSSTSVEMDFPDVEALVLNISSPNYALPSFISKMKKLKVLTITNHSFFPARVSNFSCLSSIPNLKRIRLEKVSITLLDIHQLRLDNLEKLSLVMCSFGEVFYESIEEIDISKALPSLQEIDINYCYDLDELPYWIYDVVSLKILSITNCNKLSLLQEAIGELSKLEVLRLCSCINLSELPETMERLSDLRFLDISDCLGLKKLPLEIGKLKKLKKISMKKCSGCDLPFSIRNLENLEVKCDEETGLLWERLKPKMRNLIVHEEETEHNLNLLQMF